jgi:hypothetical protein
MADVFISYSSQDRDRARTLANALVDLGLSVWWDREIVTGQAFDHVIERELEAARCVVVLWSQDSVASEWVKNEAACAAERGVLLPARLDGTRPPLEFRRKQTAELSGWSGDPAHEGFQALCRAIDGIVGARSAAPRPLPEGRAQGQQRRLTFGAIAVAAAVVVAGAYIGLAGKTGPTRDVPASSQTPSAIPGPAIATEGATRGLSDAVAGTYVGDVIADSKGGSRANVAVIVSRLGPNAVRISSSYGRIGTVDVELTRIDKKVLNATGETPFIVDLAATPLTLTVDPRGELAFRGTLKQ